MGKCRDLSTLRAAGWRETGTLLRKRFVSFSKTYSYRLPQPSPRYLTRRKPALTQRPGANVRAALCVTAPNRQLPYVCERGVNEQLWPTMSPVIGWIYRVVTALYTWKLLRIHLVLSPHTQNSNCMRRWMLVTLTVEIISQYTIYQIIMLYAYN